MVEVFALKILKDDDFIANKNAFLELLAPENKIFISKFSRISSAQRSLLGELLLRHVLGKKLGINGKTIEFRRSKNGKPYLANSGIHFNLSHSGEYIAMALSDAATGIDLEKIRPVDYRIAERFFSSHEVSVLNSKSDPVKLEYFFDLWTLKESYLKMTGTGLTRSLNSFTIEITRHGISLTEKDGKPNADIFFKQFLLTNGYKLSVCSYNKIFAQKIEWVNAEGFLIS